MVSFTQASLSETHHFPSPSNGITGMPKHTYMTVTDTYSGYRQIPLDEESSKLMTFITFTCPGVIALLKMLSPNDSMT